MTVAVIVGIPSAPYFFQATLEENAGALFVLPSQLNGAEYTSHAPLVREMLGDLGGVWSTGKVLATGI